MMNIDEAHAGTAVADAEDWNLTAVAIALPNERGDAESSSLALDAHERFASPLGAKRAAGEDEDAPAGDDEEVR